MPPRLRVVEAAPFEREGRAFVRLRDPLGASPAASGPGGLVLEGRRYAFARRLDGALPLERAAREAGLEDGEARAALAQLGDALLLDDERSRAALDRALQAFQAEGTLAPRGAGVDYEADPVALRIAVAGRVADDWDMPPAPDVSGALAPASGLRTRSALFARGYAALRHHLSRFQRVLLLAPVPAPLASPLIALDRPLATPYGEVATDRAALELLPRPAGHDLLAHRASLAAERHALFLRVLAARLPLVAVLVPSGAGPPREALAALRRLDELPGRTLVIAACDLAELPGETSTPNPLAGGRVPHPHRGGARAEAADVLVTGGPLGRLRAEDARYVDAATRLDAEALWSLAEEGGNALRRACAQVPWLLARLLRERRSAADGSPVRGSLLGYAQTAERAGVASGAALVFH